MVPQASDTICAPAQVAHSIPSMELARRWLYRHFFTSLSGICTGSWVRLLAQNHLRVHPSYWPRAAFVSMASLANSLHRACEDWRYGSEIDATTVERPIFILGHWRSGTTHLHNLLALDHRLAWPSTFQALYPQTFLRTEESAARRYGVFLPQNRIVDNLPVGFQAPMEDEFALAIMTGMSPYLGWTFPLREDFYDRYLTFDGVDPNEVLSWQRTFRWFLQKLTYRYRRPLVLKSPAHTCRIPLLLEMFPDARFVHIRRHPYAVYPSMRHLITNGIAGLLLQKPGRAELHPRLLRRYRTMYDTYFDTRHLIPAGQLHELSYEELEANGPRELARLYDALDLPPFGAIADSVHDYLDTIQGYRKNEFPTLEQSVREDVDREWRRTFEEWGYSRSDQHR